MAQEGPLMAKPSTGPVGVLRVRTRRLTEGEFRATMTPKMGDVQATAKDLLDVWPCVRAVPLLDLEGHSIYEPLVDGVYRTE